MQALLHCSDISKTFSSKSEEIQVLSGVSLELRQNESVAIVGSSGSGKSTLLHILGGLLQPTSGEIYWKNQAIHSLKEEELAKYRNRHIGFVFQFHHLLPEFTALENVCMPALIGGISQNEATEKAKDLLNFLGLNHRLEHRPNELSGGEQQRVAMCRALINDPSFLLADEPTGNLDENNSSSLMQLLDKLRERFNISILLVTHDNELKNYCDKTYELKLGQLI